MRCKGPCLDHCYRCNRVTAALAYLALAYLLASVVYVVVTKLTLGTPFHDSLSDRQRSVLAESKARRRTVFLVGLAASVVALCAVRPLQST